MIAVNNCHAAARSTSRDPRRTNATKAIGEPDQIAAAYLFLMENGFVTGTVLTADGGSNLTGN